MPFTIAHPCTDATSGSPLVRYCCNNSLANQGGAICFPTTISTTSHPLAPTSKRRRGYPLERYVKRGQRVVHGNKELSEKLGRNDLCPCGSGRRFEEVLYAPWPL
jgi:SEC-C motif